MFLYHTTDISTNIFIIQVILHYSINGDPGACPNWLLLGLWGSYCLAYLVAVVRTNLYWDKEVVHQMNQYVWNHLPSNRNLKENILHKHKSVFVLTLLTTNSIQFYQVTMTRVQRKLHLPMGQAKDRIHSLAPGYWNDFLYLLMTYYLSVQRCLMDSRNNHCVLLLKVSSVITRFKVRWVIYQNRSKQRWVV